MVGSPFCLLLTFIAADAALDLTKDLSGDAAHGSSEGVCGLRGVKVEHIEKIFGFE
jgi:hypothetical protein